MATKRIPILGFANPSGGTAGAVFPEPYSIKATNDVWNRLVWIFTDTASKDGLHCGFFVPKDYVTAAKIVVVWTSTAITGNARWVAEYRTVGGNDTTSLDQAGTEESLGGTFAAPGAANRRMESLLDVTDANFAADEEVELALFRDGAAAGPLDTIAAALILFELLFEYSDV
jgi:hypothetical protein